MASQGPAESWVSPTTPAHRPGLAGGSRTRDDAFNVLETWIAGRSSRDGDGG